MLLESDIRNSFKSDEALEQKVLQITEDLQNGKYDISNFIENLGFALTSTSIEERVNGTHLLSAVLNKIPNNLLTQGQIKYIANFFCDRLKDHHNVYPYIIDAILSIIQMQNLPTDECVTQIYVAFFQNIACQSQVRSDREKIYKFIKISSERREEELQKMGSNFIYGVINAMDGERDPKNLYFVFNFMPQFIKKFPLLHLAEEMFEIFACYFPIDFNPTKSDPNNITREKLASSLSDCLVASVEFSEWTITLALEKLESDLIMAKLDSMELLMRCSLKFPIKSMENHFEAIWITLKSDIFPGSDNQEIITKGLHTLKTLLEQTASDQNASKNFQSIILGSILGHLNDTNHRMFAPAKSIALVCVAGDPSFATDKVVNCLLLKLQSNECDDEQKIKILTAISEIMSICSSKNSIKNIDPEVMKTVETDLMKLVVSGSDNVELIPILYDCIAKCCQSFSSDSRHIIYKSLLHTLVDPALKLNDSLTQISKIFPSEVKEMVVEPLLNEFEKQPSHIKKHLYFNFKCLVDVSEIRPIILTLIINDILNSNDKLNALNALQLVLEAQKNENCLIKALLNDYKFLDTICEFAKKNTNLSMEILEKISVVLNIFVKKLSLEDQKYVLDKYLPTMNLNLSADLFLTKGILGFMHESISCSLYFDKLLEDLTNLALQNEDGILCNACHHLICSLLNKVEENENTRSTLKKILIKLKEEIRIGNEKAVRILSWVAKGLIVKGHADAGEILETLADLLNHPTLSKAACLAFDIISVEYPNLHLPIVKFLYKQKLFHIILNKIEKFLLEHSENHLNAFVFILKMTPHKVLKLNIEKIGTILFKCLEMEKISTILIALDISKRFLEEKDEYFRGHFNYLLPQFLKLAHFEDSMKVRISSLTCIEEIGKYPTFITLPYKTDVIFNLASVLDDKKRFVRIAAVKTRNLWFLIGSPIPSG